MCVYCSLQLCECAYAIYHCRAYHIKSILLLFVVLNNHIYKFIILSLSVCLLDLSALSYDLSSSPSSQIVTLARKLFLGIGTCQLVCNNDKLIIRLAVVTATELSLSTQ